MWSTSDPAANREAGYTRRGYAVYSYARGNNMLF